MVLEEWNAHKCQDAGQPKAEAGIAPSVRQGCWDEDRWIEDRRNEDGWNDRGCVARLAHTQRPIPSDD